MKHRKRESVLALIGFDPDERRMVVLRALMKAQKDHDSLVTFKEIKTAFEIEEGEKSVTDPLLYRSLTSLERDGYIIVDRTGYRHRYGSNHKVMRVAIRKAKQSTVEHLESKADKLDSEIRTLEPLDEKTLEELAGEFMSDSSRKRTKPKSTFFEGIQACFDAIEQDVCSAAKRGEIIRFTTDWMRAEEDLEGRLTSIFECLGKSGAEVRVLCRSSEKSELTNEVDSIIQKLHDLGYNLEMRNYPRDDATYQFVSKGGEGMMLIVAETPLAATWISRYSNILLIDSAVESFENDYAEAERLTE